jgi:hypothetical protein
MNDIAFNSNYKKPNYEYSLWWQNEMQVLCDAVNDFILGRITLNELRRVKDGAQCVLLLREGGNTTIPRKGCNLNT